MAAEPRPGERLDASLLVRRLRLTDALATYAAPVFDAGLSQDDQVRRVAERGPEVRRMRDEIAHLDQLIAAQGGH